MGVAASEGHRLWQRRPIWRVDRERRLVLAPGVDAAAADEADQRDAAEAGAEGPAGRQTLAPVAARLELSTPARPKLTRDGRRETLPAGVVLILACCLLGDSERRIGVLLTRRDLGLLANPDACLGVSGAVTEAVGVIAGRSRRSRSDA